MIICLDLQKISHENILFLETKRNNIMSGNFTKLNYSNEYFTMNGLYLLFPIEIISIDKIMNKKQIRFSTTNQTNRPILQELSKLENRLLEMYKSLKNSDKRPTTQITKQINTGILKVYNDYYQSNHPITRLSIQYIIKISGLWETEEEIGITYKLFEVNENYC
jgi:hypothetical protein